MTFTIIALAACICGVAPERANDFHWENGKVGFRAYGPGDPHVWSGIDLFNKMPDAQITCAALLKDHDNCGNWHTTPWKGVLDNYAIGAGRGVGGVALFGDGEWKTYPNWEACEIIHQGEDYCEFKLIYPAFSALGKMTCHITLNAHEHFFRNEVSFEKPQRIREFKLGPGLDLNPSRGHKGEIYEDAKLGIVALYEETRGDVEGSTATAIFLDPKDAAGVELAMDHQGCRVLALRKPSFTYYAGCAWSKAGQYKSAQEWFDEVKRFAAEKAAAGL